MLDLKKYTGCYSILTRLPGVSTVAGAVLVVVNDLYVDSFATPGTIVGSHCRLGQDH